MESGAWQAAHKIVQDDEDSRLFCWAHGIVHLMEGDVAMRATGTGGLAALCPRRRQSPGKSAP